MLYCKYAQLLTQLEEIMDKVSVCSDTAHGVLKRMLSVRPYAYQHIKTANLAEDLSQLPGTAFADPSSRNYPLHSPEHAAISYLYAIHNQEGPEIMQKIIEALDVYGIPIEDLNAVVASEEDASSSDVYLFPESKTYPVRDAAEVKFAETRLLAQERSLLPETKAALFSKLAYYANLYGVKLTDKSYKYAALAETNPLELAAALSHRARITKDAIIQQKFAALRDATLQDYRALRNRNVQIKLASAIAKLDEEANLVSKYASELEDPMLAVFSGKKYASGVSVTLGDHTFDAQQLAKLPITFWSDALGPEVVPEITHKGQIDIEALKIILDTLPADTKARLGDQIKATGC
jgi:hypothetical protein